MINFEGGLKICSLSLLFVFLIGCATKKELRRLSMYSARNSTFQELCEYVRSPNPFDSKMTHKIYENEWRTRHDFSKKVEEAILADEATIPDQFGKVIPSMSKRAVKCARGKPSRINTTRTTTGTREQWIYRNWGLYVQFENDSVISISETKGTI